MKYELAVFDLDGTVLDTLTDLDNSLNFALDKFSMPKRTIDETRAFVGNGIRKLIERGVPSGTPVSVTDEVEKAFNEHYAAHCADNTKPYGGIHELIKKLREAGIKTAVVSNKADYAVQTLCKKYFDGLFDFCVGARENVRKKPFPDSVNEVIKTLNADRTKTVYIGDSEVDIATAANAGVPCLSVTWGFRDVRCLIENGATDIVSDMKTLFKELTKS